MENAVIVLLILMFAAVIAVLVAVLRKKDDTTAAESLKAVESLKAENESLRKELSDSFFKQTTLVNDQLSRITAQVNDQLSKVTTQIQSSTGQINDRMDNAARVVGEVKQSLGALGKATEQVFEVGKDIASLQEILRAPKLRGELGEFFLGDLLSQILPKENFALQHTFRTGARVDAIVKMSSGIVSVDSKFPLENFKKMVEAENDKDKQAARKVFVKDVKKRIDEIALNYILPDEGTFNFALMYVPAENVYYETIIKEEASGEGSIAQYAFGKRVIPVSPNSFYAYLQTILFGLRGLEVGKRAQAILQHIESLKNDFAKFADDFEIVGKHISNARGKHEEAQKRLERMNDKLISSVASAGEMPISGTDEKTDVAEASKPAAPSSHQKRLL
ncbi:MAG: DNA recombination protein RmuC [Deltaproteobacteria bacterium]|nr:DNA recombination protein RmuC [Deltaproteobacteria bacterium]